MGVLRRIAIVLVCAAALAVPAQASAAVDIFLDLDGIQGEARDATFPNTIEVLAWSWGVSRSSHKPKRPANFQDISLTKFIDRSSPALLEKLVTGETIANGSLRVRKAGATPLVYVRLCFTDLRVSSISTGGSGGEDRLTENVTLSFGTIIQRYTQQSATGGVAGNFQFGWDLVRQLQFGQEGDCA
jgi:type VI secretion system secreted protein Hcp